MRRKDREITDASHINDIILSCDCCRLGFIDGQGTYILPLNFGFVEQEGKRILYFHGAREGKKTELVQLQPHVGFEMDTSHKLMEADAACLYSFCYRSIIGQGNVSLVEDMDEKLKALRLIMEHYSSRHSWDFPAEAVKQLAVIKLVVTELSCKEHI